VARPFERVYTVTDYYDGPRGGVATFDGKPHFYESEWSDLEDDWADTFRLTPIDDETLELACEAWQIWLRWERARHDGSVGLDSHPALPAERPRYDELQLALSERLRTAEKPVRARATFRRSASIPWDGKGHSPPLEVEWTPVNE